MTREEAIEVLKERYLTCVGIGLDNHAHRVNEALNMAIEALQREEAEEKGWCHRIRPKNVEVVVRCKDCRHWLQHEQFGFDEDNDEYHDYCALLVPDDDYYAYTRKADDFCSSGERREP